MSRRPNRRPDPGSGQWWIPAGVTAVVLLGLVVWGAMRLAGGPAVGNNPPGALVLLATGRQPWPAGATVVLVALLVVLALVAGGIGALVWRAARSRTWIDSRAAAMATAREFAPLTERRAQADAVALHADYAGPGVPLARATRNGQMLYASWQYVQLWIMGPRAGKTSCVVVPQVCATVGPVFATSNKRDLVDLTETVRRQVGRVWVFDPQRVRGTDPTWWWDPLSYVTDLATATKLAAVFAAAVTEDDARSDGYFEPEGQALLAAYLYAAALGGHPVTTVWTWLNASNDVDPARALSARGEDQLAEAVFSGLILNKKQKDGVYGTSRKMCRFLTDRTVLPWVTATGPDDTRPRFHPAGFAVSTDTVYALSKEGAGTARALTAALTMAVADAAEAQAESTPVGRMVPPLLMALDEAANIVRWPALPDLLSHYGSKGIVVSVFLQSYSQGAQVWGQGGMRKMWSACNVRGVGSGIAEPDFLRDVSTLIGDRDVATRSVTSGGGSRSMQLSNRREATLDPADLASMPTSRAVLFVSGVPAALVSLRHWSAHPFAAQVAPAAAARPSAAPPWETNPLLAPSALSAPVTSHEQEYRR
ncbi:hypothetical protein GCM10027047_39490 [Rhodococcus aerolatus]